jgi:acyl-CoA synthetase (AMP-forming)/AMP-acid ligase II
VSTSLWRRFERIAERHADRPALFQGDRTVGFAELRRQATAAAGELARRGLGRGDRCLIWAANSPEMAAALLAAWRLGAIVALVNDEAPLSHLAHAAEVCAPRLAVVEERNAQAAGEVLPCPVLVLGASLAGAPEPPVLSGSADHEPASIFFTSGSTGAPKGVVQSPANLIAGAAMVARHLGLDAGDRILCPIPWSFDYGYGQLLSTVLLGVPLILPEARNPFAFCEAITAHKPTVFAGLPSIFALLIRGVSPLRQTDLRSLRLVTNTGGKIAPAIFADVLDLFGHCDISLNYGLTETYRTAGLPVELAAERPDSVGFAYPGVGVAVVREDGREAEPDEVGEIVHRGAGVFLGYWNAPEATARTRRPDPLWSHPGLTPPMAVFTGDLGWKDADGFLYVKGRRDRLIKSMGVRVSPDEIETLIRGADLVRDVAVVGVPHELMGEMVVAAITVPEGAPDPRPKLKAFARQAMSQHMQPREYRILEAFPLTPNGKTDFARLRAMFTPEPVT